MMFGVHSEINSPYQILQTLPERMFLGFVNASRNHLWRDRKFFCHDGNARLFGVAVPSGACGCAIVALNTVTHDSPSGCRNWPM